MTTGIVVSEADCHRARSPATIDRFRPQAAMSPGYWRPTMTSLICTIGEMSV